MIKASGGSQTHWTKLNQPDVMFGPIGSEVLDLTGNVPFISRVLVLTETLTQEDLQSVSLSPV